MLFGTIFFQQQQQFIVLNSISKTIHNLSINFVEIKKKVKIYILDTVNLISEKSLLIVDRGVTINRKYNDIFAKKRKRNQ